MYDYNGDMEIFQKQLTDAGISRDELNITDYAGLTARELRDIVKCAIANKRAKEGANNGSNNN